MTLAAWTLVALRSLPVFHEDVGNPHKPAQEAMVAWAVSEVSESREEAARLLTVASHETHFSYRIHYGLCLPDECDKGRALGLWQAHQNGMREGFWRGSVGLSEEPTLRAAFIARTNLRRALGLCKGEPDETLAMFRAYAGRGCRGSLPDEAARVTTYRKLLAK